MRKGLMRSVWLVSLLALSVDALAVTEGIRRKPGAASLRSEENAWDSFLNRSEASYYLSWAGPSLGERQFGASYNPFVGDKWPMQFYSELYYGYRFAPNWTVGILLSGIWNFVDGVSNRVGPVQPGTAFFHPAIQLKRANLIDVEWLNVWGQVQVFLPTSSFAREMQTFLFSIALDNTWKFKFVKSPWSFGINTKIQPSFYERPTPDGPFDVRRETFYMSIGHFLSFQISDHFSVNTNTVFDTNHWGGSERTLDFGPGNDDRWKVQLNWYPGLPLLSQAGVFVQGLIFKPMLATTILGMDMTLRL